MRLAEQEKARRKAAEEERDRKRKLAAAKAAREREETEAKAMAKAAEKARQAELDKAMATRRKQHKHAVAVIIGNRDYAGRTPDVAYAGNDAKAMRDFVINNLGYRPGNVIDLRDASLSELNATFGTANSHKGRLYDYVRAGKSDVIVFYSGHGVPGQSDRKRYLLPVDANPNQAELNGYPLDTLLGNLAKVPARSMAVYLDACFSGESEKGPLVRATSGLTVQPRLPQSSTGMVVVTAAQNDQFASWDEDAKHGLFTKHLLEALRGKADGKEFGNGDGKVTLAELKAYLNKEMTYQARRRWSRDQKASVKGNMSTELSIIR
ncbi:MAG: caspase family protein [Alphaproteobacteria bacterium]|nr:caspase family protein [Alphaproteobacteria bacterium]